MLSTGAPDNGEWYIDPYTQKAQFHITRPKEKEYFRWLNHMNAIGLLDKESFVQKEDQYLAKISSGRVLGLSDMSYFLEYPPKCLEVIRSESQDLWFLSSGHE